MRRSRYPGAAMSSSYTAGCTLEPSSADVNTKLYVPSEPVVYGLRFVTFGASPDGGTPISASCGARANADEDAPVAGSVTGAFVAKSRNVSVAPFTGLAAPAYPSYTTLPR